MKTLILVVLLCIPAFSAQHYGSAKDDKSIDNPLWVPVCVKADSVQVSWVNEFGMPSHAVCVGVWYSATRREYMLTQKGAGRIILQANNISELNFKAKP